MWFSKNTLKFAKLHTCFYRQNFHSLLETLANKNSRLLHTGRVNKAYIFVITAEYLLEQTFSLLFLVNCSFVYRDLFVDRKRLHTNGVVHRINTVINKLKTLYTVVVKICE